MKKLRKLGFLVIAVLAVMLLALPAMAQEGEVVGEEATQAVNALVTVGFLSVVIALVIERIRRRAPNLDGDLIVLISTIIGYIAAWAWKLDVAASFGYEGLPVLLSYLVAALVIAGVSGFIGTAKGAISSRDPNSEVPQQTG